MNGEVGYRKRGVAAAVALCATAIAATFADYPIDQPRPGVANQVHLSWVRDPSSSFTVTWHTASRPTEARVEYRIAGSDAWQREAATTERSAGAGYLHKATVAALEPASEYEYRLSNGADASAPMSPAFLTRTAPASKSAEYQFAFLSDTGIAGRVDGNASGTRQIIEEIAADDPLFILGGGDYAYANFDGRFAGISEAVDAWFRQMEPLFARAPFMAQYGNHEIFLDERYSDWAPRFVLPSSESTDKGEIFDVSQLLEGSVSYSFDVGPAHFTGLFFSSPDIEPERLAWLDRDLRAARARGAKWLIVYQHEPVFAHGYVHASYRKVGEALAPILERHEVHLHLSAHDQSYERTFPLKGVPGNLTIASRSPSTYAAGQGVTYLKISPSGKMSERNNEFSRFRAPRPEFVAARNDTMHHYALVTVKGVEEIRFQVFGVAGDASPKQLVDEFRILAVTPAADAR